MRTQRSGSASPSTPAHTRKRRIASIASVAPLVIGLASTQLPSGAPSQGVDSLGSVHISCTLPFEHIRQHHPVDDACGPDGNGKPDSIQAHQNDAKNNFCASGPPVNVTFDVLHQLQDVAAKRVTFGSDASLPKDRSQLLNLPTTAGSIGEGTVAREAVFIMDAHYSNVGSGESVNCKRTDKESNDIHIVLAESADEKDECNSATAEMSPHFRPDLWNPDILNETDKSIFKDGNKKHMFRFTGQLFFDGSHSPCSGGKGSPKRSTLWELHPVYNVEICIDPNNHCSVDSDVNWKSLAEFVSDDSAETQLRQPQGEVALAQNRSTVRHKDRFSVLRGSLGESAY